MTQTVLVDFNSTTKKLSTAHFDSEAFSNASRRILQFESIIINDVSILNKDLTYARAILGQLLHALHDFYSHSNWIEMNQPDINYDIGINETIDLVSEKNQSTCTNNGCTKIVKDCNLWQYITIRNCPLVYYDCQNNILSEINIRKLLTSGYSVNQHNENNDPVLKPTNVAKCSHGSVYDDSSNIPAIGGINEDANSLIYSHHADLHFKAAGFAEKATEQCLNVLRREIGDTNFDRLFCINPLQSEVQTSIQDTNNSLANLQNWITKQFNNIKSILSNIFASKEGIPTYDISDLNINTEDTGDVHAAPFILKDGITGRKRRLIEALRHR